MITEGKITINIGADGAVTLQSNRISEVGRLFIGRKPDEVLDLLPLVFSLCGRAHVAAARQAISARVAPDLAQSDARAVLAENAREHLLRILTGWQVEGASDMPALEVMSLVRTADEVGAEAVAKQVSEILKNHVLGIEPADFLAINTPGDFFDWLAASPSIAARYLGQLCKAGMQSQGATQPRFLPLLAANELTSRLADPGFAMRPEWDGHPHETGPLARQKSHPMITGLKQEFGSGLLVRLVARLVDLAKIPQQLQTLSPYQTETLGLGVVETARGRLIHQVRMDGDRIVDYRTLAPTEWNFHPEGVVVQALKTLPPSADIANHARVLIEAIDPCVDFEVRAA